MIGVCLQLFGFQQDNRGVNPHGIKVRLHGPTSNVPISQKRKFYRMGHPPLMVDILPEISGVDFDAAWEKRVEAEISKGLKVLFIDTDSLLASKLAAGRPEDLADVAALQRAARIIKEPKAASKAAKTAEKKTPKP